MHTTLSLKELEKRVYRSTYQDGLWDIYAGGMLASFAAFAGVLDHSSTLTTHQRILISFAGVGVSSLIFRLGKKLVTVPRLGQVTFGAARARKKRTLAWILTIIVAIQTSIVLFTILLWQFPSINLGRAGILTPPDLEKLFIASPGAIFVGPSMAAVAFFNDFPRGYYLAVLSATSVFCLIWFGSAWFMVLGGLLMILPGIFLLVRFMQQHPIPTPEA